jgi:hypothetical protein
MDKEDFSQCGRSLANEGIYDKINSVQHVKNLILCVETRFGVLQIWSGM